MRYLAVLVIVFALAESSILYDDFSGGIDDWHPRCGNANWYAYNNMACLYTTRTCSALVFPEQVSTQDGVITVYGTGNHVFGVIARLSESDSGVYAYLSIDHNVARIRRVMNGNTSTIYSSLYTDFPMGDYIVTLVCSGPDLTLYMEHVQSSQTWMLSASVPGAVQSGEWGLAAGETSASWHWVELQYEEVGMEATAHLVPPSPVIRAHKNPFSGQLSLLMDGAGPGVFVEIFDLSGRKLESLDLSSGHAVFTPESPGIYLARCAGNGNPTTIRLVCLP